jgi:hypothetical protein
MLDPSKVSAHQIVGNVFHISQDFPGNSVFDLVLKALNRLIFSG